MEKSHKGHVHSVRLVRLDEALAASCPSLAARGVHGPRPEVAAAGEEEFLRCSDKVEAGAGLAHLPRFLLLGYISTVGL